MIEKELGHDNRRTEMFMIEKGISFLFVILKMHTSTLASVLKHANLEPPSTAALIW
jgi:hypothetical protein